MDVWQVLIFCSTAVPLMTHQADCISLKLPVLDLGNMAFCAHEKESRAQYHKCLLFFPSEQGLGMGSGYGP